MAGWSLRTHRVALVACIILLLEIGITVAAPLVAPYDPIHQERAERLLPPGTKGEGSGKLYLFGTDTLGRDVLSRLIYGARISLSVGILAVLISAPLGVVLGLCAGYFGRAIDEITMRIADIQLALPSILLAMAIVAILGPSSRNIILVLGISGWILYARIVRSQVLALRDQEFVQAARAVGCSHQRIIFRHILPNLVSPIIVLVTLALAYMILLESSLSFLGLGVQPPTPEWGAMLNEARDYVATAWWISVGPGIAIMITVLSVNFLGDWLRDLLDPRERLP